jgi:chromosomal replication initiator protein
VDTGIKNIPLPGRPLVPDKRFQQNNFPPVALRHFVVGPENYLVEAAVRSIFETDLPNYNPLVFYGADGTGKTHLAHGLASAWIARYRHRNDVRCTTALGFARELAEALETQALDEFRGRYRNARLVIIDDVHRLAGKSAAQLELLGTIDALVDAKSPVVATVSSAFPDIPGLIPALLSRLAGGLAVPLSLPRTAARLAILRLLVVHLGIQWPDECASLLAAGFAATVPELHGALLSLAHKAAMRDEAVSPRMVQALIAKRAPAQPPSLREIAGATAKYYSLKAGDLRGLSQRRSIVLARDMAIYLARWHTDASLKQIGRFFGRRDVSTIKHGYRQTETLLKTDAAAQQALRSLRQHWQNRGIAACDDNLLVKSRLPNSSQRARSSDRKRNARPA